MSSQHPPRRRKRRPMNGVKTVEVVRGTVGYGFTISGQNPCTLSCIVSGSPAEAIGLRPGDFLLAVNGENVSKYPHDEVVRIIGTSVGTLTLQVAEKVNSSDSSDDDLPHRQKFHHPNRMRPRRALKEYNYKNCETRVSSNQLHDLPAKTSHSSTTLKLKQPILTEISNVWDLDNKKYDPEKSIVEKRNISAFQQFSCSSLVTTEKTRKISNPIELKIHSNSMDNLSTITDLRAGRFSAPIHRTMSVDSEESEEEWSPAHFPDSNRHFVVGYIGSIEMPGDKNWQHAHLQSFHSAVRRLRSEKKIHTLVVMSISIDGVKLTNAVRKVLAIYPVKKIAFCGLCPDDNHFFGIVTFHGSTDDDANNANIFPSCSCHVFRVNTDIRAHGMHVQKARMFQFECTRTSNLQRCYEFPKTAAPVIRSISELNKGQCQNNNNDNNNSKVPMAKVFMEPQSVHDPTLSSSGSSCHSSNSDSGLGFSKDDSQHDGVFIVDMNQTQCNQRLKDRNHMTPSATLSHGIHHLSPSIDFMPTPQSAFRQTAKLNSHVKVLPNTGDPKQGRLTLRAMPDPVIEPSVPPSFRECFTHQKYRSKLNIEHRSRSREPINKKNVLEQRAASSERPLDSRSISAPFHQLSNQKLTVIESSENHDSLEDKLSPRATSVTPKFKIRSPSAPPAGYSTFMDQEWSPNIRRPLEEIFAIFEKDSNQDDNDNKPESRRYSDGQALLAAKQETNAKLECQMWKKRSSFRRPKVSKLSHSHESLVVNENEGPPNNRMSSANSIHSIVNYSDVDVGPGRKVSRVASWAVSFNRLLEDPEGVLVFTEFLRKEFSEENIQFWLAVDNFKRSIDPDEKSMMANEIFEKHLGAKAAEPVNVDSLARHTAQQHLNCTSLSMFDSAQKQIFQLMKQDSYSRFLKSDLYKSQLVAEMEGKVMEIALKKAAVFSKIEKEVDKKKLTKGKEEEKRRWSLLPWKQKSTKQSEIQKLPKLLKDESKKKVSLATMDLSLMRKEVIQNKDSVLSDDFKFCRVLLPDNSTAVVCAKSGQTIQQVLGQLFDKRNLTTESTEVFLLGSDKPLDLSEDMSTLGSKEVNVERRVFFHVEISSQKRIGVKAKLNKTIYDVFRPILQKYGFRIENVTLQLSDQRKVLDLQMPVSTLHNNHISVIPKDDDIALGNPARATISAATSLEEITNKVFEDLMHGKSESAQPLANTDLNIYDPKKSQQQQTIYKEQLDGDRHCLDTSVLQRRGSTGRKDLKLKLNQPLGINLVCSANNTRTNSKISFPNKDHSITGKTRNRLHSSESNNILSDLKRESLSVPNLHLITEEYKVCPQDILATESSPTKSIGNNSILHGSQQNSTITIDSPSHNSSKFTKSNVITTPSSIWLRKGENSCSSPSKLPWLKFGADARDIQHFKTFGSTSDRSTCNITKGDHKDIEDDNRIFQFPYTSKASIIQNSGAPTNSKPNRITNSNSISAAPIASPEDFSSTADELRSKKSNLKIRPIPLPIPALTQCDSNSSKLFDATDNISAPLELNKFLYSMSTSPTIPEYEYPLSKVNDESNCSPILKYNLSVPQSAASLNSASNSCVYQLEVSKNPQVTFV